MKSATLKAALCSTLALGLMLASVPQLKADGTAAPVAAGAQPNRGQFAKKHPRRAQVLKRANRQEKSINNAAANGKLTGAQAQKLDGEDQRIKAQEQRQAAADGGHITKAEQRQDNREENRVHRQEMHDEKVDATTPPPPAQ